MAAAQQSSPPQLPRLHAPAAAAAAATDAQNDAQDEARLIQVARWEHQQTTRSARRCLQVVNETRDVAAATLVALDRQGQQLERAAHGVEQIDENVQHAGRILAFMSRFCCFRNSWNDPDLEREARHGEEIGRQRAEGVIVAAQSAHDYAAKRAAVGAVVGKSAAGAAGADEAAARSRAEAAALADEPAWGGLIAAVPGPLGEERQRRRDSAAGLLGHGLPAKDRQSLQAESAAQEAYLEQVDSAVDALKAMGLAMGEELQDQAPKIEALQQRTEAAGLSLKGVSQDAARLVGPAPRQRQRRGGPAAPSWAADQDAAAAAVARAAVAAAPTALKYGSMRQLR
ncbi:Synaptosomal-associated 25 [Chlorella sorokiniana]|uniref:Synaptosomal-associated 25 n=1 Tax=Chlorella sorokiniana TaxID=3076 RepID=A0A2P6TFB8_CHLSO|nr:Synaptosomal-associated 25 [Chlorella sorokiniana]|eukprot:PRW32671.1 Synaptosomal-associated 25 [Chlorella sorokiniana]